MLIYEANVKMSSEKRVSIHWIKAILSSAKSLGIETQTILSDAKIDLNLDHNQTPYLSLEQTQAIWLHAEKRSNHKHFGIVMGQAFRPSYFHVVAYLAMTSTHLKQAYIHFIHYLPLISEAASLSLHHEGDQACIVFTPQTDKIPFSRHQHESAITLLLTFTRWLVGNDKIAPNKVMFEHDCGPDLALYKTVFSIMPKFNQKQTCIYFPAHLLALELADSDASLNQLHLSHAKQLLTNHQQRNWREMTLFSIRQLGVIGITKDLVAQHLNVSPRTLQRRLNEENTHYQTLLDEFKRNQALSLIQESDLAFKVIAIECGFAEPSTFYRAIGRWFNMTPQALRQSKNK